MQRRYTDRGRPYDHDAWRNLYKNTLSPGVYSGYTLSPSVTSASQVTIAPGALLLPSGIVVVEDHEVTVQIGGVFPPSLAADYTVRTVHQEVAMGLIGGAAMTYQVTSTLLTEQPSDGIILGWIRHPGGGTPLDLSHITDAPKFAPADVAADRASRMPIVASPPDLPTELGQGVSHTGGFSNNHGWRGFSNPSTVIDPLTASTPVATSWFQYQAYTRPYEVQIRSIIPIGCSIDVTVYDSSGVTVTTANLSSHTTWQVDTISVPSGVGTFTTGSKGTIKLVSTVAQGTIVQLADIIVDFWPYAFSQF